MLDKRLDRIENKLDHYHSTVIELKVAYKSDRKAILILAGFISLFIGVAGYIVR